MTDIVFEANNITRTYAARTGVFGRRRSLTAVKNVSFSIKEGRTLGVVGESGSGKSTLARIAASFEQPSEGEVRVLGRALDEGDAALRKALRLSVQMVFQNPYGSLNPRKTIRSILEEPLRLAKRWEGRNDADRIPEMMKKVGLRPELADRYPHMFSGGQCQRIAIARALMLNPKLVVADEAVSALDASVQAQILNLLLDLQDEFRLAYLFISHDLSVVKHIADDVLVMYFGYPVELGPKEDVFGRPLHPYTQLLLAASESGLTRDPVPKGVDEAAAELPSPFNPPIGCSFAGRCPKSIDLCRNVRPLPQLIGEQVVACHRAGETQ